MAAAAYVAVPLGAAIPNLASPRMTDFSDIEEAVARERARLGITSPVDVEANFHLEAFHSLESSRTLRHQDGAYTISYHNEPWKERAAGVRSLLYVVGSGHLEKPWLVRVATSPVVRTRAQLYAFANRQQPL